MKIKFPYGTSTDNNRLVMPGGQVNIDTEYQTMRLHDGLTPGGLNCPTHRAVPLQVGELWERLPNIPGLGSSPHLVQMPDGTYVAASHNNVIRKSTNLQTWATVPSPIVGQSIVYIKVCQVINGLLYLAGSSPANTLYRTADLVNWEVINLNLPYSYPEVMSLAFSGSLFVLVFSGGNHIATSLDGVNWTELPSRPAVPRLLSKVTYHNGTWIATGSDSVVLRSIDGYNWVRTRIVSNRGQITDVVHDGNRWVTLEPVFGFYESLDDGLTWTDIVMSFGVGFTTHTLIYHQGMWVVTKDSGSMSTSTDLLTWTNRASRISGSITRLAVIDAGLYAVTNTGQLSREITE